MDLNKVMLIGRLTRDPEARSTPAGQSVCSFSVATSRKWNDQQGQKQEKTEFHNIVAWGKLSDICSQYLTKGKQIYIEGRLQTRDWEGQDGVKRYRTEVVMDNMIMLGSKGDGGPSSAPAAPSTPVITEDVPTDKSDATGGKGSDEINVEDIPF